MAQDIQTRLAAVIDDPSNRLAWHGLTRAIARETRGLGNDAPFPDDGRVLRQLLTMALDPWQTHKLAGRARLALLSYVRRSSKEGLRSKHIANLLPTKLIGKEPLPPNIRTVGHRTNGEDSDEKLVDREFQARKNLVMEGLRMRRDPGFHCERKTFYKGLTHSR